MGGPVPKRKISKSKSKIRTKSKRIGLIPTTICKKCGKLKLSHQVCIACKS